MYKDVLSIKWLLYYRRYLHVLSWLELYVRYDGQVMEPNMERNPFLIQHFVRTYNCNSKTIGGIRKLYISNECSTIGDSFFLVSYGSKHSSQFFPISHLCILTHITWQQQVIYRHSAYRMTSLLSNTFLVWFRVAREIQMESYGPRHASVVLWYKLVCVYCKPIYTSLFGAQTTHDKLTHVPYDCILHTKRWPYCQRCIVS